MVTITGKGFPGTSASGHHDIVEVALPGGGSCAVLSSSYSTVTCIAGPQPAGAAPSLPIKNLHPGMRGMVVERYPNRNYSANSYGTLWQSAAWKPSDSYPGGNASASSSTLTSEADFWFDLSEGRWVRCRRA
jgi:hypothetical protein